MSDRRGEPGAPAPEVPPAPPASIAGLAASVSQPVHALSLGQELGRKALHVSSVIVPVAYAAGAPRVLVVGALAVLLLVAAAVELVRTLSRRANVLFRRYTGSLLRAHEHRALSGATWLLVAFLASVLLFERRVAIAAMCAVALGDAAGAVVGRWLGRLRLGGRKSLEGSVACALATYAGARLVAALDPVESAVAAIVAAIAEWPERPLDDNVRLAIATGGGILLWRLAFS